MARGRGWTQRERVVVREKGRWKTPWPNPAGKLLAIGQSPAAGKFQAPNGLGGNVVRHVHHGQWHEYAVFISLFDNINVAMVGCEDTVVLHWLRRQSRTASGGQKVHVITPIFDIPIQT